jgi:hypothetical protein
MTTFGPRTLRLSGAAFGALVWLGAAEARAGSAVVSQGARGVVAGEDTRVRHFGPVGVEQAQVVVVAVTNRSRVTLMADAVVLDAAGQVLVREQVELQPGQSETVRWTAPATQTVRALVSAPAASAEVPTATYVYNGASEPNTSPALTLEPRQLHGIGQAITTSIAPYAPILIAALQEGVGSLHAGVANLGPVTATFTVSFFDDGGTVLLAHALTVAPGRIGRTPPVPQGARVEVAAPQGTVYLATVDLVDAAGRTTAVLGTVSR